MATYYNCADVSRVIDCIDLGATEQAPNVVPVNFRTPPSFHARSRVENNKVGKKMEKSHQMSPKLVGTRARVQYRVQDDPHLQSRSENKNISASTTQD